MAMAGGEPAMLDAALASVLAGLRLSCKVFSSDSCSRLVSGGVDSLSKFPRIFFHLTLAAIHCRKRHPISTYALTALKTPKTCRHILLLLL
jgi:hypothetical protein